MSGLMAAAALEPSLRWQLGGVIGDLAWAQPAHSASLLVRLGHELHGEPRQRDPLKFRFPRFAGVDRQRSRDGTRGHHLVRLQRRVLRLLRENCDQIAAMAANGLPSTFVPLPTSRTFHRTTA